ncbi:MAG: fibronectin type III domain-containing protein [Polyangiaceae bacterium]|nr:fibronectin type III domain-containing protein [Polyangiaceae bacterium]MCB9608147.1 fibronectin type III domain-containing protein [Polyangiaceae bacterium]
MRHRLWLGLCAAAYFAVGCGGGSDTGGGGDPNADTTPPTFDGASGASVVSESRIDLSWSAATDNVSDTSRIVFRVYGAATGEEFDFTTPWLATPSGASTAAITGLSPSHQYRFVVRAVDEAGNEDQNTTEVGDATPDGSPPKFAGVSLVEAETSSTLRVEWKAGFDKGTDQSALIYNVYLGPGGIDVDLTTPVVTSAAGESSVTLTGLSPLTDYAVIVRSVDTAGNEDENTLTRYARTPEGVAPSFSGAKQAIATGQTIKLYWFPATDNVTEPANIVYDIYEATEDRQQNFGSPSYTSPPGAISFVVPSLMPNTKYYYVVRARDAAGNRDNNTIQVNATTGGDSDTTAPSFNGVDSVAGSSPSTLLVSWTAATDTSTPDYKIRYQVFVADTAGVHDFNNPTLVTTPGITSTVVTGLPANATRFVVVRAMDEAGNVSVSSKELSGTTLAASGDTTAPTWSSGPSLSVNAGLAALDVSWVDATDDTHSAAEIRYHVCAEPDAKDCEGAAFNSHIRFTTALGATTARLSNLSSRTLYNVYVRAEDMSGNFETGNHSMAVTTAVSYRFDILPLWRDQCNGCHSFQHSTTVNVPGGFVDPDVSSTSGLPLILPGQPENSLIYRRINPDGLTTSPFSASKPNSYSGLQEPRDGNGLTSSPLSGAEDGLLREWIEQGAFAN